ncbi:hypothetical protein B9Q01_04615 [Candidatus Marsarchaeota G1 archaeon OSP_D]|uniref:Uncharacterized protein n=2 Tax=Candidatus Marsarchaeota group 1 TaxID=2203770 RepID=A0A2R6AAX7_9ARCH|nr:MAG: hypothetical protein B9Q01_04615 [Candidatus Marsarchaeota G1 archaeon OSP_D]PSN88992.1 MAG: hypothetical protein B9Q00_03255 [Candidatus Marsarchaeota G1 archaeon OSP_C]
MCKIVHICADFDTRVFNSISEKSLMPISVVHSTPKWIIVDARRVSHKSLLAYLARALRRANSGDYIELLVRLEEVQSVLDWCSKIQSEFISVETTKDNYKLFLIRL